MGKNEGSVITEDPTHRHFQVFRAVRMPTLSPGIEKAIWVRQKVLGRGKYVCHLVHLSAEAQTGGFALPSVTVVSGISVDKLSLISSPHVLLQRPCDVPFCPLGTRSLTYRYLR